MARSEIHAVIFNCSRSNGRAIAQTPPPPQTALPSHLSPGGERDPQRPRSSPGVGAFICLTPAAAPSITGITARSFLQEEHAPCTKHQRWARTRLFFFFFPAPPPPISNDLS